MDGHSKPVLENGVKTSPVDDLKVRYITWGIFTVACDYQSYQPLQFLRDLWGLLDLSLYKQPSRAFLRFLKDMWALAPLYCLEYYMYTSWMILSPALSSYLAYRVLQNLDIAMKYVERSAESLQTIQIYALMWLTCGVASHCALTMLQYESRVKLGPHLRAYFLPKLVKESLKRDVDDLRGDLGYFPGAYDYGDFTPGWDSFNSIFTRLRHILAVVAEILVVLFLYLQQNNFRSYILSSISIIFILFIIFLSPVDAAGGKGYTFWTKNEEFNRLMALFHMVFDFQYRATLIKDQQINILANEYERVSKSLGPVKSDTYMLGWTLYPSWKWGIIRFCVMNSPMALVALTHSWVSSTSPVVLMAIVQYAITTLASDIDFIRDSNDSFLDLMTRVMRFYALFERQDKTVSPADDPVDLKLTCRTGVEIELKSASYHSVQDANLKILPGQLILITGGSGSGKDTLVKLLSGIILPTQGEVRVDGQPSSNAHDLTDRTVLVGKSDVIYPISLQENIAMAVPNRELLDDADINEAVVLGGAYDMFESLGRETVLLPCSIPACSIARKIGLGPMKALQNNSPNPIPVQISEGQRQHIVAARAFLRLKSCRDIGLVILDEATSAMDPVEEREVLDNFCQIAQEKRMTLVIVSTHILLNIAQVANMIIYMEKGTIEAGPHEELLSTAGYAELLQAGDWLVKNNRS